MQPKYLLSEIVGFMKRSTAKQVKAFVETPGNITQAQFRLLARLGVPGYKIMEDQMCSATWYYVRKGRYGHLSAGNLYFAN